MILLISLNENNITLTLKDSRKIIGELAWTDEYTLSEKLLPNIDALLKKCKVSKHEVTKVTTKITKTSGVTSSRIVQTVAKAWELAQKTGQTGKSVLYLKSNKRRACLGEAPKRRRV